MTARWPTRSRPLLPLLLAGLVCLLLAVALPGGGTAQTETAPNGTPIDYGEWETTADRAEESIQAGRASTTALETLRKEIASWRERLLAASTADQKRIATLQSQLDALGPAPEEGASEAEEIAARRDQLKQQLATLRAPIVQAEEAYSRADGLIGEIDNIIRLRETDRLLTLGPSPLNPANWPGAFEDAMAATSGLGREFKRNWNTPSLRKEMQTNLPLVLLLLVVAATLLLRGRHWATRAGDFLRTRTRRGTGVWSFLVSVGLIALPLLGIVMLTQAVNATGMLGLRGGQLLGNLPLWAFLILGFHWLAVQLLRDQGRDPLIVLVPEIRNRMFGHLRFMGVILALRYAVITLADLEQIAPASRAVIEFPLVVLAGFTLFRLGQLLWRGESNLEADDKGRSFLLRVLRLEGQASIAVAVVAPLLAAVGYRELSAALIYPAMLTIALMGLTMVLHRFLADLYQLLTGKSQDEGLIPVLLGFVLLVLALPVLWLIWGARVADLTELWARFREGFDIGGSRISPTDFLTFAMVFVIGYTLTRLFQGALRSSVLPKTRIDIGGQNAIVVGVGYVGLFVAALVAISAAGLDLSSFAIVAGALSVGIGFGLQNIVSNFVSGIILLIERPISEGDWIEVNGQMGYVRDISVRSTRIETFDRTDVIVPNADLVSGMVTNYTRGNTVGRVIAPVGVAYGTDTKRVETILREIAEGHPMIVLNPAPSVVFQRFGADSLEFEIRGILRDVNWVLSVKSDLNHEIAKRFAEEGIEIPFAQRDLWLRNPEVLRGTGIKEQEP